MSEPESLHGLSCPKCGGVVPIPEGQSIVRCPYCDLRSFVRGARGILRYQVPQRQTRESAVAALHKFLTSSWAIARNAAAQAQLSEAFLVYLPFWSIWSRIAAWVFGQEKVGSGDRTRYEAREKRVVQEMTWNGAACDVGEFGVYHVPLTDQALEAFNPDGLHASGLVFEPVGSFSEARAAAEKQFDAQVRKKASLDRLGQVFTRTLRRRETLVYYPLWVLRYLYRGRVFQVLVDGSSGKVLYGKAPGNTLYRAAVLVAGMALGAFLAVDGAVFALSQMSSDSDNGFILVLVIFGAGLALMWAAYRRFRYGEEYEYRLGGKEQGPPASPANPAELLAQVKDVEQWISRLS